MDDETVIPFPAKSDHGDAGGHSIQAPSPAGDPAMAEAVAFENLSLYPLPDDPYVAHSRPHERSLPRLLILQNDGKPTACSYHDLRLITGLPPRRPGNGPGLLLRFSGIADVELWASHTAWLCGRLYLERLAWIRELPPGWIIKDDSAVVITRINIKLLRPVETA